MVKRSVEGSAAVGAGQDQKEKREEEEAGRGTSSRERGRLLAAVCRDSLESGGGYVFVVSLFVQFQIPKKREN